MSRSVYLLFHVYSRFIALQIITTQRSLSAYFRSLVQPPPRVKRKDVIDTLRQFRFKAVLTRRTRQEAYNAKSMFTLFLSVPMATLCEFVTAGKGSARL